LLVVSSGDDGAGGQQPREVVIRVRDYMRANKLSQVSRRPSAAQRTTRSQQLALPLLPVLLVLLLLVLVRLVLLVLVLVLVLLRAPGGIHSAQR